MDLESSSVVVDEAHLSEAVQEEARPRAGGADHRGQRVLADLRNDDVELRVLAEVREQQEQSRQTLLAGVEELIHQVFLDPHVAGQQVGGEKLGEIALAMEPVEHRLLRDPYDDGSSEADGRRHALRLPGETSLAEERPRLENGDHRLFPARRYDRQLDA